MLKDITSENLTTAAERATDDDSVWAANPKHRVTHKRQDGLIPEQPFFVIQLFDHEGYFSSRLGMTEVSVREKARSVCNKTLLAFSLPFEGTWSKDHPNTPDTTMPDEFKTALAKVNKPREGE